MFVRTIVAIVLLFVGTGFASAAAPEDVAKVAAMVTDRSIPTLLRRAEFVEGMYMGDTIVFVHKGMRYTFYHSGKRISPDDRNSAWLAVWVRKDGTSGRATMETFSDNGFDGTVNSGIVGNGTKYFVAEGHMSGKPGGAEFRAHWQRQYDAAIQAALEYMRHAKR